MDIALFLAKFLSGKNNIIITPMENYGFACRIEKIAGREYYNIIVPRWDKYNLPLDPKSKYRIFRSSIWHECLPQGHHVLCLDGLKDISEIRVGDLVLGHDGRYHKVTNIKIFYYEGNLIKIRPTCTGHYILATFNHPFYAVKKARKGHRGGTAIHILKQLTIQEQVMKWVPAEELSVSNYLLMPILVDVDVETIRISDFIEVPLVDGKICYRKNFGETVSRPDKIPVDHRFLTFCGFYVAEGHAEDYSIVFSFGRHEERLAQEVLKIGEEIFEVSGRAYYYPKKIVIHFNAWYLSKLFKLWFGSSATTKKIPLWIKKLPARKIVYFLDAYMQGDGCKTTNRRRRLYLVYQMRTASKTLAFDIFQMMLKMGIVPSICVQKQRGFKKGSLTYQLNISASSLERFMKVLGVNGSTGIVQRRSQSFINRGYAWLRIRSIERIPFKGFVYNLEVEESSSFVTELVAVHNSMHSRKIKGARDLPLEERQLIEDTAAYVEKGLKKIMKEKVSDRKVFQTLKSLTEKVIKDLQLQYYRPPIRRLGESSWDVTFTDFWAENQGTDDEKKVRAGIDDYFDEIVKVEYICEICGKPYTKIYGHRHKPGGRSTTPPPGVKGVD
jgi:intein/homing endonuclease